jgi:hypothetical protein
MAVANTPSYCDNTTIMGIKSIIVPAPGASESGLLNKSLRLATAVGVTKFVSQCFRSGHTLLCYLSLTWMFNKPIS